uniref:Reverse transcriptase domain-containing protein n=1 Tax=Anolis carolinensis TaxID=28377 RepID=A0A803TF39_ANOCA
MLSELKVYINNVNGLNSQYKRNKIFDTLSKRNCQIIALQETHIAHRHVAHLENKRLGNAFYASAAEKKRGVVTYVNKEIPANLAFKDGEGRFVGVNITIQNVKTLICNIYAPNDSKKIFIDKLQENINNQEFDQLMIVGDYNGVIDGKMDRSKEMGKKKDKTSNSGNLPKQMINMLKDFNLVDAWREKNEKTRDYTFYSSRHKTWSRIDMVWTSKSLVTKINKIRILPRLDSDHCPIELKIYNSKKTVRWKLDDNLLKKEEDIEKNRKLLTEYFRQNDTSEVHLYTVWEASKAVMRGYFIQQKALKKKRRRQDFEKIMEKISKEEELLKKEPKNENAQKNLQLLHKQREHLEMEERANQLKYIKQDYFQNANKPGRWLAKKLRKKREATVVTKLKEADKIYTQEEEIRNNFAKFYKKLYQDEQINKERITEYIGQCNIQRISEEQREELNKEITEGEIIKAIKSMKTNKAPGPDGLTAIYYKTFQNEITPYLKKIMNEIRQQKKMPSTWKEANICLIHKENSDPENVKNYRPISLLNVDYKIFSNVIAERFKRFLKDWVKEDQTGFLPDRHQKENVRTVIDLIEYYEINNQKEVMLLALDAEKAFDNVNWNFVKMLIKEMDIGYYCQNIIEAIYEKQETKIIINGQETNKIKIEKGTRQGCPLSPLIFILTLEILLNEIRKEKELKGATIQGKEYKVRAYADDLICIIEEPLKKLTKWMETINKFGEVAGFKINMDKTKAITKNITKKNQERIKEKWNIQISTKINYLGIIITPKNLQLLENNYTKKWKEIKKELEAWGKLNLSLLGRVASVKMNILPKMIFLFQNLPIIRNQKIINGWKRDLMKYIWQGKKARINYKNMIEEKNKGGLAMADLKLYFEASALAWFRDWAKMEKDKILTLEGIGLRSGWHSYIWYEKEKKEKNFGNHFVRSAILKIWMKYKSRLCNKIPLWLSPLEAVQRREMGWRRWPRYKELVEKKEGEWKLKSQQEMHKIDKNISWFQYWQVKEKFTKDKSFGFAEEETFWDKIMISGKKIITKIYKKLLEWDTEKENTKKYQEKWSKNIGREIRKEEWEEIWRKKLKYTCAIDLKENWIKMAHRWYWTPKKLGKCYKNVNTKCWKCGEREGTLFHIWWTCKEAEKYWGKIRKRLQEMLEIRIPLKPEIFLLGITDQKFGKNKDKLFFLMTTAARICFAKRWKEKRIPEEEEWIIRIMEIINMDRLTYLLSKNKGEAIRETDWSQITNYLNKEYGK